MGLKSVLSMVTFLMARRLLVPGERERELRKRELTWCSRLERQAMSGEGREKRTHRAKEKKTPERRDSSWSQEGLFCMVVKVERTRVILSVTPKEEVLWVKFG